MGTTYISLAEEVGFEPTEAFTSHAFQACRFGRSRTLPYGFLASPASESGYLRSTLKPSAHAGSLVGGEVAVGSCATVARKPGQVLTEAASTRERSCAAGRLAVTSVPTPLVSAVALTAHHCAFGTFHQVGHVELLCNS